MAWFIRLGLSVGSIAPAMASDHDDGATHTKSRNLNLTDLYVFREDDQNPHVHSAVAFFDKGPQFIRIHDVGRHNLNFSIVNHLSFMTD